MKNTQRTKQANRTKVRACVRTFGAMRSIAIAALVAVIGFLMAACATGGSGTPIAAAAQGLTITGLEAWNGMFIQARGNGIVAGAHPLEPNDRRYDAVRGPIVTGAVIADGTATLNVWNVRIEVPDGEEFDPRSYDGEAILTPYTGSETMEMEVTIWHDGSDVFFYNSDWKTMGQVTVTFANGSAQAAFVEYD